MIAAFMTWPYGTFRDGTPCILVGLKETTGGEIRAIAADLKTGELSVLDIKDVVIDVARLRKLPL
jgi:hypothetical protein